MKVHSVDTDSICYASDTVSPSSSSPSSKTTTTTTNDEMESKQIIHNESGNVTKQPKEFIIPLFSGSHFSNHQFPIYDLEKMMWYVKQDTSSENTNENNITKNNTNENTTDSTTIPNAFVKQIASKCSEILDLKLLFQNHYSNHNDFEMNMSCETGIADIFFRRFTLMDYVCILKANGNDMKLSLYKRIRSNQTDTNVKMTILKIVKFDQIASTSAFVRRTGTQWKSEFLKDDEGFIIDEEQYLTADEMALISVKHLHEMELFCLNQGIMFNNIPILFTIIGNLSDVVFGPLDYETNELPNQILNQLTNELSNELPNEILDQPDPQKPSQRSSQKSLAKTKQFKCKNGILTLNSDFSVTFEEMKKQPQISPDNENDVKINIKQEGENKGDYMDEENEGDLNEGDEMDENEGDEGDYEGDEGEDEGEDEIDPSFLNLLVTKNVKKLINDISKNKILDVLRKQIYRERNCQVSSEVNQFYIKTFFLPQTFSVNILSSDETEKTVESINEILQMRLVNHLNNPDKTISERMKLEAKPQYCISKEEETQLKQHAIQTCYKNYQMNGLMNEKTICIGSITVKDSFCQISLYNPFNEKMISASSIFIEAIDEESEISDLVKKLEEMRNQPEFIYLVRFIKEIQKMEPFITCSSKFLNYYKELPFSSSSSQSHMQGQEKDDVENVTLHSIFD